jgi:hypothetical protein
LRGCQRFQALEVERSSVALRQLLAAVQWDLDMRRRILQTTEVTGKCVSQIGAAYCPEFCALHDYKSDNSCLASPHLFFTLQKKKKRFTGRVGRVCPM